MARIIPKKTEKRKKENPKLHEAVDASCYVYEIDGKTYLQIDTYGRDKRKIADKVSQSIQIDCEMASYLIGLIQEENTAFTQKEKETYSKEQFLQEVYLSEDEYEKLVSLLENKKNLILQGAPGVGKTFTARRLAWAIMNTKDNDHIELVQFHQNYSYEDFMLGYKPNEEGFKLNDGIFYKFCQKAVNHPDEKFFFIIDEINRGNLSKIFGELLMLIEKDYRGTKATLGYNGLPFSIPDNLYIIGMMNTADRSLAMIDYALRRRFGFFKMKPGFDSKGFKSYQKALDNETFNDLISTVKRLNTAITSDRTLGEGFCIGHSYFCNQNEISDEWMNSVIEFEILPMLEEYWFDDPDKVDSWKREFDEVLKREG